MKDIKLEHGIYSMSLLISLFGDYNVEWKTDCEKSGRYFWYNNDDGISYKLIELKNNKLLVTQIINNRVMGQK